MLLRKINLSLLSLLLFASFTFLGISCKNGGNSGGEEASDTTTTMQEPETREDRPSTPPQSSQQQQQRRMKPGNRQMQRPQPAKDVSDEELKTFVKISQKLGKVREGSQEEMMGILESEGMDPERYTQIMQDQRSGQGSTLDVSDEEMGRFQNAQKKLREIQVGNQDKMIGIIKDHGMTTQRFQSIQMGIQQDPKLRKRFQDVRQNM